MVGIVASMIVLFKSVRHFVSLVLFSNVFIGSIGEGTNEHLLTVY